MYQFSEGLHTESMMLIFKDSITHEIEDTHFFINNGVLHQSWMTLLDLNDADAVLSTVSFQHLADALKYLHLSSDKELKDYANFLGTFDGKTYTETIMNVLDLLKDTFDQRPALGYLYPGFYRIMVLLYGYVEENAPLTETAKHILDIASNLTQQIARIQEIYSLSREYVTKVFITPYQNKIKLPTSRIAFLYQTYCLQQQYNNYYSDLLNTGSNAEILLHNEPDNKLSVQNWEQYLSALANSETDFDNPTMDITSIDSFMKIGIDLMLKNEMVLRKCRNCGGYFCVKYTTIQDYCNRGFSNASTCSEYVSRKSYKDRLFENPINSEYTKAYNKLYARIRRKKLASDTPLKDELLRLRNEYIERYEHTHKKDREAVWKEYIQKNKELLG